MTPAFSHWQNYWTKRRSTSGGAWFPQISLRFLLVALFVLLTLGTVGVVQFLWIGNGQRAAQELANRLMDDVGGRASLYLNNYLQTPQQVNRLNTDAVSLGELDLQNLPALEQHLITRLKQFESLSSIQVGNSRNDFRLVTREEGWRLLQADAANSTRIDEYAIDGAGRKTELLGTSQATVVHNQLWYQTALFNGKPTWGVISKSATGNLSLTATQPVYDSRGQVSGVFSSALFLNSINTFLNQLSIARYGKVFIIEKNGWTIATSDLTGSEIGTEFQRFNLINSPDLLIRTAARSLIDRFGDFERIVAPQQIVFAHQGQRHFLQVMPFQDQYGLDWRVVITVPEAEFLGQINLDSYITLLLCIAALLVSALIGLMLARCISRPIRQLSGASHALAVGEWHQPLPENSPITEIQVLTHAFNRTAKKLQQSFDAARAAVQESEEKFTKIFRSCPDPIAIVTPEGRYLEINDAYVDLFEYSREEIIGRTSAEVGIWANYDDRDWYVNRAQVGKRVHNQEFNFRNKSGRLLTVLFSAESLSIEGQRCLIAISKEITDRKQLELALQASEAKLNNVLDGVNAVISSFRVLPDGTLRCIYRSKGCETVFGYTAEELLADPGIWRSQLLPEDRDRATVTNPDFFQRQHPFTTEYQFCRKDGELRWLSGYVNPHWNADAHAYDVTTVVVDITDRKQAEKALRQSEARFQKLAATSPAELFIKVAHTDGSVSFEYISPMCREIHELEPEQILENAALFFDQMHPEDRVDCLAAADRCAQTLTPLALELRLITPSNKIKWVRLNSRPEQRSNGDIVWYGVLLDITDRKQAEAALRQSEARFVNLASAAPGNIYSMVQHPDGSLEFEFTNRVLEEFHEMSLEKFLIDPGKVIMEQMHPDDRAGYLAAVDRSIETLRRFKYEWRIVLPDGRIKWLQAYSQPERRRNGDICWHGVVLEVTDRKQAEAALQQSEATKNQILKAIPDLIIWMTADGTFIDLINSGNATTNLYPRSDAIGQNLYDLLPFEMAQARMNAIQRAMETGDVQVYEQNFMLPTGIRYEEVRVVSVEGDRILVIVRDITQRHRIETERRQALADLDAQRAFLRQVIDVIPSPVFVKDLEGRFTVVNQALAAIHNLTVDDLLGKREAEFNPYFSQERFEQYQANHQEVMLTRQPQQNPPHVVVTTTGERRWLQSLLSPLIDIYGQVQGVVGNAVDVTDLKQAGEALQQQNQALQESQERFRSAFEDAPIGMALIGLDDRWLKVNPMLSDMLGYSESILLSMNASAVVHPEDQDKLQNCVAQVLSNESRSAQVELRYCCNNGRIAWGLMSLSLVQDARSESSYYVAQIQDITEQQAIDRMKNDFIAIVSHELRTPLTAIRGFLGLLNTGIYDNRPEKAKRMVEQALTNSDRLVRLVNDILDLERLSSGRVELVMEVCDAADLMQRAVEGVQSIADAAAITLVVTSVRFQVWAAPDAIIQTLTNLLSNAIKFAPRNTIVILSVIQQSDVVLFQVKDRGRGIPSDKLETIFGRFQQVDVSDARQKGGTGLGLAICQSIVQQHGGSIWAESTLGEGSTFFFTLPLSSGIEP